MEQQLINICNGIEAGKQVKREINKQQISRCLMVTDALRKKAGNDIDAQKEYFRVHYYPRIKESRPFPQYWEEEVVGYWMKLDRLAQGLSPAMVVESALEKEHVQGMTDADVESVIAAAWQAARAQRVV